MAIDHVALMAIARAQHGLITRKQALEHGATDDTLTALVRAGLLLRIRTGVYASGGAPTTWEQVAAAACLAGGPDVLASHRTAARLWGLVDGSGRVEVTVDGERRVRLPGVTVHQSILLVDGDRASCVGIPTTSLARTIIDVSGTQSAATVGRWVDARIRGGDLDLEALRATTARMAGPGRRRLRVVRRILAQRLPGYDPGDSELEVRAMRVLARSGLPTPVQQHPVVLPDGSLIRLDLAYPRVMVAIELDGWAFHGDRTSFERDRLRANQLTLLGWRLLRFTAQSTDTWLAQTVAAALAVDSCRSLGPEPSS